LLTYLLIS